MSEVIEIVDTLESRIKLLLSKYDNLEIKNHKLQQEISNFAAKNEILEKEYQELQQKYHSLKIANSLLGSEDFKKDTKLKINSLIREIDYCIAQLSD